LNSHGGDQLKVEHERERERNLRQSEIENGTGTLPSYRRESRNCYWLFIIDYSYFFP